MITISTTVRRPWFGHLVGGVEAPHIELTPLGQVLEAAWRELPERFPGVEVYARQVMPDHFHGLMFFTEHLEKSLGRVVGAFKGRVTVAQGDTIWAAGFNDRILRRQGQLSVMRDYIRDNPRRLALKHALPDLFRVQRGLTIAGRSFTGFGNPFLVDAPEKVVVKCSRSMTDEALARYREEVFRAAEAGAVLVSPVISRGEQAIAAEAVARGYPLIRLRGCGFPPYYKPAGIYFDACVAGKLLILAPWAYIEQDRLTRALCMELNHLAALIAWANPRIAASLAADYRRHV